MQGIYHNPTLGLISLVDGDTVITIADKNLGATTVYNDGDTLSEANCGKYYQWGNNYGFPRTGDVTTSSTQVDASSYGPGNYYSSSTFITRRSSPYDRSSVQNDNLRGGVTGTNEAMQGPCPSGYHIPKNTERQTIYNIGVSLGAWTSSGGDDFRIKMKLPFAGLRNLLSSSVSNQGSYAYYWSSTAYSAGNAYYLVANSSTLNPQSWNSRAYGVSIRPFKNTPVMPDKTWTVLYGDVLSKPTIIHGAVGTRKAIQTITPPIPVLTYDSFEKPSGAGSETWSYGTSMLADFAIIGDYINKDSGELKIWLNSDYNVDTYINQLEHDWTEGSGYFQHNVSFSNDGGKLLITYHTWSNYSILHIKLFGTELISIYNHHDPD